MLAPVTHILPITTIRRERVSPIPGKVMVRRGQEVGASDVIVEANLRPQHKLVDVSRLLALEVDKADEIIKCQAGDRVETGDLLAGPVGISRRVLRSPLNGRVVLVGGGQILLDVTSNLVQIKAGIPGEVVDLVADRGAVVETTGALVQCVWGNGKVDFGVLSVLANKPDHELTADQVDVSLRGSILLAGHCADVEALKSADEMPLRGLILSSLSPELIPLASKLQLPVIITEGFGRRAICSATFNLLTTNERRDVAINAEKWDRQKGTRPELVIPLPGSGFLDAPRDRRQRRHQHLHRRRRKTPQPRSMELVAVASRLCLQQAVQLHRQAARIARNRQGHL